MAIKKEVKKVVKIKKNQRQKILVAQGRVLVGAPVPFKVLYTEIVESAEKAKERIKELNGEYAGTEALSISYFSI